MGYRGDKVDASVVGGPSLCGDSRAVIPVVVFPVLVAASSPFFIHALANNAVAIHEAASKDSSNSSSDVRHSIESEDRSVLGVLVAIQFVKNGLEVDVVEWCTGDSAVSMEISGLDLISSSFPGFSFAP